MFRARLLSVDDGGAGIYRQFASEEAADRRRLGWGLVVAVLVHVVVLAAPLGWWAEEPVVTMPAAPKEAFLLRSLRFAPPEPPAAVPVPADPATETLRPDPPAPARAEILVPPGPAAGLVPPQPLRTPPPPSPESLWSRGLGAEVRLTVVVDPRGEVAEVTVEEVLVASGAEPGTEAADEAEPVSPAQRSIYAEVAAEAVRQWRFLPATHHGNPVSLGIGVRVMFPAPEAGEAPVEPQVDLESP